MLRICLIGALALSGAANVVVAQDARSTAPAAPSSAGLAGQPSAMGTMSMPMHDMPMREQAPAVAPDAVARPPAPSPSPTTGGAVPVVRAGAQVSGVISLKPASGQDLEKGEQADTLVYFIPSQNTGSQAKPGQYTVYTHNREFSPEAIAIPQGSKVTFVNLDDVRHNVFSVTPGATFNLGYQSAGDKASQTYPRPGLVLIGCRVHRSMELDMMVIPSRYATQVSADGSFVLRGLPQGPGTLTFWNPRGELTTQKITLPTTASIRQDIAVVRERMVTQLNTGEHP